ncbi:hypothetical protein MMC34_005312 [Xylographa carneopallida]|nr:hypothetical protein [Xylographa carneopallida]
MDRDKSPSPSPRNLSTLENSSFTSPPFTSTLPLPYPLMRPRSYSRLHTRHSLSRPSEYPSSPPRSYLRPRSAASSVRSRSSSVLSADHEPACEEKRDFDMEDYTIDLGNLGQSSAGGRDLFAAMGGTEIETPEREREVVGSEDEGPEDFTVNMGKWMGGVGEGGRDGREEDEDEGEEARGGLEEKHGEHQEEETTEENHVEDQQEQGTGESDQEQGTGESDQEQGTGESDQYPHETRRASVEDVPEQEGEDESVIVTTPVRLDVYGASRDERSTTPLISPQRPLPPQDPAVNELMDRNHALQAEIERLRLEAEHYRKEIDVLDVERAQSEAEFEDLATELTNANEKLTQSRRENLEHQQRWDQEMNEQKTSVSNVSALRAKFEPLAQELEAVRKESEAVKNESSIKLTALAEQLRAAQDQVTANVEAGESASAIAAELEATLSELARCKQKLLDQQEASRAQQQALQSENHDLQLRLTTSHEVASELSSLKTELQHAQEQLSQTRHLLETVENENDRFTQTNDRKSDEIRDLRNELNEATHLAQQKQTDVQERDGRLKVLEAEMSDLRLHQLEAAEMLDSDNVVEPVSQIPEQVMLEENNMRMADQLDSLSTHYEAELAALKKSHQIETKKLKAMIVRAAEGMRKREARLTKSHAEEVDALQRTIKSIRLPKAPEAMAKNPEKVRSAAAPTQGTDTTELRSAIRVLSSNLKAAQEELFKAQENIRQLRQEAEDQQRQQQEREQDQEAVNRALEERFAEAVEKREKEWRRRMRVVLKDREVMGKALLLGWGREEVGEKEREDGEKGMGYRYRFVKR